MVLSSHQQFLRNGVRPGLLAVAAVLVAASALQAQAPEDSGVSPMPTILDRSPFIPPGWAPPEVRRPKPKPEKKSAGYEFRGVYQLGGEFRFLVSEPRSRSGNWVQVGESYEGYEVRDFDPKSETLTLFFNNEEVPVKLADLESNPTPIPVTGQIKSARQKASDNSRRPVRRTIRPASRNTEDGSRERTAAPPPPAWLQKLREEAASRRAQAGGASAPGGASDSGVSASSSRPDFSPPPPPDFTPPTPPPNISEIDIPPPPTTLPPEPPPEIMQQIQQSISGRTPGT